MIKHIKYAVPAVVILATATPAMAETVSWPGGNCVTAHASAAEGYVYWDGRFTNRSMTSQLQAYCPIETSSSAPQVSSASVVYIDRHTSDDPRCTVTSQWINSGGTVYWYSSSEMRTSGYASGPITRSASVNFGSLGQNMQLQCRIPEETSVGASAIFRYQITR